MSDIDARLEAALLGNSKHHSQATARQLRELVKIIKELEQRIETLENKHE